MPHSVSALFETYAEASVAVARLRAAGFAGEAVSVLTNDRTLDRSELAPYQPMDEARAAAEGSSAATGAGMGAVAGGAAGAVAGLGLVAIPGIAPLAAAGWIAASLAAAGAGGLAGGLIGALTSAGVPEGEARTYGEGLERGGTFVIVRVSHSQDGEKAVDILSRPAEAGAS